MEKQTDVKVIHGFESSSWRSERGINFIFLVRERPFAKTQGDKKAAATADMHRSPSKAHAGKVAQHWTQRSGRVKLIICSCHSLPWRLGFYQMQLNTIDNLIDPCPLKCTFCKNEEWGLPKKQPKCFEFPVLRPFKKKLIF